MIATARIQPADPRRGEMPGRIEVRGVVGRKPDPFDRPAFAIRQVLLAQPGEEFCHLGRGLAVGEIFDLRAVARRIGGDVISSGTEMSISLRAMGVSLHPD
jgi:hypothetical protein